MTDKFRNLWKRPAKPALGRGRVRDGAWTAYMFHSGLVTMSAMLDEVYDRRPSARRSLRSGNLYTRMRRRAEEFGDRIGRAEGRTSISCATAGARQAPGTSCTIGAGNGCAVLMASSFSGIRNWLGCTRTTRQSSGAVVGNKLTLSMSRKSIPAIAYLRTSSTTNAGPDKDSDKRQRAAIAAFAKAHGYAIVDEFYDAAVSGSDPIGERPGFKAMLDRIAGNGVHCIVVESPDRFARDLTVQLTGHDFLKSLGVSLIPATAPDFFTEDTPTAVLVRQVLGAIAQFEKTSLVSKLKAARDRKKAVTGKCGGRKTYAEAKPEVVALAKELHGQGVSLRKISAELATRGYVTAGGRPYVASAVQVILG